MKNNNFSINDVKVSKLLDNLFKTDDFTFKIKNETLFHYLWNEDKFRKTITFEAHFSEKNDIVDLLKFFVVSTCFDISSSFKPKIDFQARYDGLYESYSKDNFSQEVYFKFPSPGETLFEFSRKYNNKEYLSPETKETIKDIVNSKVFAKAFNNLVNIENFEIGGLLKKTVIIPIEKINKMSPSEITNVVNLLDTFEKLEQITRNNNSETRIELLQARDQAYANKVYELLKENHFLDKEPTRQEILEKVDDLQKEISQKIEKGENVEKELKAIVEKTPFLEVFNEEITSTDKLKIFEKNNVSMIKAINALEGESNDYTKFMEFKKESFKNKQEIEELKTELSKTEAKEKGLPVENKEVIEKFKCYTKIVENLLPEVNKMIEIRNKEADAASSIKFNHTVDEYADKLRFRNFERGRKMVINKDNPFERKVYAFLEARMEYKFYSGIENFIKSDFKDENALKDIIDNSFNLEIETINNGFGEEVYCSLSRDAKNTFLSKNFLNILDSEDKTKIASYLMCEKIKMDNVHEESAEKSTTQDYTTEYSVPSFNQLVSKYKTEAFNLMNSIFAENKIDIFSLETSKIKITKDFFDKIDKDLGEFRPIFETICEYKNLNVEDCKKAYSDFIRTKYEIEREEQEIEKSLNTDKKVE